MKSPGPEPTTTFSLDDVLRFAGWSEDRNPLHVHPEHARQTHFGQQVVHGVLSVLETLRATGAVPLARARTLDIEFRGAVLIGQPYSHRVQTSDHELVVTLSGGQPVLSVRARAEVTPPPADTDTSWAIAANRLTRDTAAERTLAELREGVLVTGCYDGGRRHDVYSAIPTLSHTGARVLALCSYVTGMEVPGLRSLFTRITLSLHDDVSDSTDLRYRARTTRFDPKFRLLDTDLTVAAPDGRLIATGQLRSYVPFSPANLDLDTVVHRLAEATRALSHKTALVTGGSRGLGADIAATLAVAGVHVYVGARHDDAERLRRHEQLRARGASIEFLPGDAGDPAWCKAALAAINARHGRLDILVLNACAPPVPTRLGSDTAAYREQYLRDNLRLVQTPLDECAEALANAGGTAVFVSSSFVKETPPGFSHYVALKQAGEGLVTTLARERPQIAALVARPPVLQTRWNDTPAGVAGAIPADWAASHLVNALAVDRASGETALLTEFPALTAPGPVPKAPTDFAIRLAASFTTDPLLPPLRFWLDEAALDARVDVAPYGQVLQSLLDPTSVLNGRGRGANVILLRVRDWLRELPEERLAGIEGTKQFLRQTARDFEAAVRAHRGQSSSETLLVLCPSYGTASAAEGIVIRETEDALRSALDGVAGLQIANAADFHEHYGVNDDEVHDELRNHIAHIPYRDDYLYVLAAIATRHIYRRMAPVRKVVVVDCDNTLWHGVVGEVGAEGVEFGPSHRALHALLARLAGSGVLVCLCSKNEESDVWRVFDTRPDLGVRRDQVVAAMINWQPKSLNLRTLAARLNLGLDSFVFLDDNPVECAEVRAGCPEVLTIQWPHDHDEGLALTRHIWEFDARRATKEDARRTELYKEEFQRQEARAETLTFEDFIQKLQLEVDFSPLADEDLRRSAQLTLRTNQFNFTTIRREEADVLALAAGGTHEIRTVRVRDRFGDYGLVGLVIAERGEDAWRLDTFLLSCRVLGRGVEHRILADLGQMAAAAGAGVVKMRVETTKRNTPARSFFDAAIPAEFRRGDDHAVEAEVPVHELAAVRFEPASAGEVVVQEEGGGTPGSGPLNAASLRRREQRIARAAFELSSGAAMRAAAEGRQASAAPVSPVTVRDRDVADVVHAVFASALGVPPERVAQVDALEALGCDSMRIVEITVALSERYPWLPSTLLFEHRAVSDIVREIVKLSRPVPADGATLALAAKETPAGRPTDIAVVGVGVRCAGADSPEELWALLREARSAVEPVAGDRRYFLSPLDDERPHWAGLLDGVGQFDPEFFGVSPREAEMMDPQLRLLLQVAWSALEDAGAVGAGHEPDTGVFAGVMYGDYAYRANSTDTAAGPYRSWEGFSLANRLSQLLDFHGPSFAVETACSSSGTALHLACSALKAGECKAALVGGVNLILDPARFASLGRLGILSPRGVCEPFGAEADGTVLGEGAGVVVLRPLADALARGDRIYGVIKGTALSTGSGTVGFTAPNPVAQAEATRRCLRAAGIDPRTVSYIETHGTGTLLGDPIEIRGLSLAYTDAALQEPGVALEHRCAIGSIKPNIGHLEAGAGVLGFIKILLQFAHRALVPSRTSGQLSPQIPFARIPFTVQRELAEWAQPVMRLNGESVPVPRRAGLNSFGVGGANAHLIVEEPPDRPVAPVFVGHDRPAHVMALAGVSEAALARQIDRMAQFVAASADIDVADVCRSVNTTRRHLAHRAAVVASDRVELLRALKDSAAGRGRSRAVAAAPKVAFLFTGQGSQYAGMGRALYESQPVFRDALDRCARTLDTLLDRSLVSLLFAPEGSPEAELLHQTGYTQPALFSLQYALSRLWESWGVVPDVVMGHSVGEIAAMCVVGGLTLEDGLTLIAARGRLMQALPAGGVMTSVMADEARVQAAIGSDREAVAIAAVNAPGQVVISGASAAVAEISARLSADGIKTRALTVSHAFHSPLMKPMLTDYERVVRSIRFAIPRVPLVSCVEGSVLSQALLQPEYWLRQVMDPVQFVAGMRSVEAQGVDAYVEVGPHPVLLGMGRQCVSDESNAAWVPSLRRDADAWSTMLHGACQLYEHGVNLDWAGFDAPYPRARVAVPAYVFGEREYWLRHIPVLQSPAPSAIAAEPVAAAEPRFYETTWRPRARRGHDGVANGRWLILADQGGVGRELADELERRGATSTIVQDEPGDLDSYDRLIQPFRDEPLRVVHLWNLDTPGAEALNAAQVAPATARGAASVAFLLGALARANAVKSRLDVVTQGAVSTGAGRWPLSVAQAAAWGMGRTAALEHPDVFRSLIDLESGARADVRELVLELLDESGDDEVALHGGGRLVPRLTTASLSSADPLKLTAEGTYLITGGLGALGLHAARWLVEHGARRLVLASRNAGAGDTAAVRASIDALTSRGVAVDVMSADVSDAAGVDSMLARIEDGPQPLRGIVHAAGVDTMVPIAQMDAETFRHAMAAKACGAWLLHERTRNTPLDVFIVFSSLASVLGSQGRGHYAAANAFVDALAHERRRQELPVTVINWGPWRGGGMATAEHLRQFERVGNRGLDPAAALRALGVAVASGRARVAVADIDWDVFKPAYEARRRRPLVEDFGLQRGSASEESAAAPWVARLSVAPAADRLSVLETLVQREVAETMGFDDASSIPVDRNFYELGVDSLMMADLVGRVRKQVGMACSTLIFEHPTARGFARRLLPLLPLGSDGPANPPETPAPVDSEAPPPSDEEVTTGYDPAVEPEVVAFQKLAWPHRDPGLIPARWHWMFVDSARRLGVEPRVWLHRAGGRIVGHMGSIPIRLQVGDGVLDTGWLVDTMVSEDHRRHGLGSRLMVQAHEDQPFSLSLGQTVEMREIQYRLGWQRVAPLEIAQLVIRPDRVLRGKLPRPAALAAGLGMKATSALRDLMRGPSRLCTREVERFDDRHDLLWQAVAPTVACAVVRDASYLNWKYVEQPGQAFVRLEVTDKDRLVGVAVLALREPDAAYKYRRALLVDLVAPFSDETVLQQVVLASAAAAEARGADAMVCLHVGTALTKALKASGFTLRTPERFLLVDAGPVAPADRGRLLNGANWLVTQGDSDIDRPW